MRETFWHVIILLSVSTVVFFFNLGETQLWDRDEPRNAGCAAEMLAQGQWVVPIFNDELRHQKPVLLYWLIMSAYSGFGGKRIFGEILVCSVGNRNHACHIYTRAKIAGIQDCVLRGDRIVDQSHV